MKDGYYWVKHEGDWVISFCQYNEFIRFDRDEIFKQKDFDEIGDYIETPEKYKL